MFIDRGKVRFVAGLSSVFLNDPRLKLTRADYGHIAGINGPVLSALLKEDPSLDTVITSVEEKKGLGPHKHGPPAQYVFCALRDMKFKESMNRDKDFQLGFWDQIHESWKNGEIVTSNNLRAYARQQKNAFKSNQLLRASKEYRRFLNDTRARVTEFCRRDRSLGPDSKYGSGPQDYHVFMRHLLDEKEKQIDEFLVTLSKHTDSAIKTVRHMKYDGQFAEAVLSVNVPKIRSLWSDFLTIHVLVYFVSPWSADEFGEQTEFFKTSSECFERPPE